MNNQYQKTKAILFSAKMKFWKFHDQLNMKNNKTSDVQFSVLIIIELTVKSELLYL